MKPYLLFLLMFLFALGASGQKVPDETSEKDTLQNVVISAFESYHKLLDVPAPVNLLRERQMQQTNNLSWVRAMNNLPGVNMDERSPGSYRLNIRGSSIRSPFGVRNVKIYYNGIPMTDPGGSTFFQILGPYNATSIEIIKGPSGSVYGTGTGGVVLLNDVPDKSGIRFSDTYGSYNTNSIGFAANIVNEGKKISFKYNRQSSDGFREHTKMYRDVFSMNATLVNREKFKLGNYFLYGRSYYQTPGALTLAEYKANPRSARPHAGPNPSADEAKAAFTLNYFLSGFKMEQQIANNFKNYVVLYGAYAQNRNPNFRNYSRTSEPHFGGRTDFTYSTSLNSHALTIDFGGEYQHSFNGQRVYKNNGGEPGAPQTDDEIQNTQAFAFVQAQLELGKGFLASVGTSVNFLDVDFHRFYDESLHYKRSFRNEWAPRLNLSKQINEDMTVYASVARGFSPPATSELLPSTDIFNTTLQAESGINYELGWRASVFSRRLFTDVNLFSYNLKNAITQKRDASGGDYFSNAGKAVQRGLEVLISAQLVDRPVGILNSVSLLLSGTWHHFAYKDYKPGSNDFSGNKVPGVSPVKFAFSGDVYFVSGTRLNVSWLYNGKVALNDANSEYASDYFLVHAKVYQRLRLGKGNIIELFTGADNMFNAIYSLGNDINGAVGRYYNVAPGRSFYGGISLDL
ncbi:MAG: TonB-dependent receptor [Chitinophagaceae bacterium]|nr:TonB-dependent receptor [Chitinophagaceae bacterium]MCZ2397774.1 TonB-dependent receptor [Chitinophagales bacterium]